ncbi:TonB-dependent receptor [Filimonas effusa]|uniref:TonB-dependent receptor n=2 Tax=Filimonas effusa TaxID=2508721 RepID=A0A4Q1D6D4_9BACT|nr:TonB-dependent receptor [Filimonas effusa]
MCNVVSPSAQLKAQTETSGAKPISLKKALEIIGNAHNIKFAYERSLVNGIEVTYNWAAVKAAQPELVLQQVLSQTGLSFVAISKNYFTIVRKQENKPQAVQGAIVPANNAPRTISANAEPNAFKPQGALITGIVTNASNNKPIEAASVSIPELGAFSVTDNKGLYRLPNLPAGTFTLNVQGVNTVPLEKKVTTIAGISQVVHLKVEENVLSLKEVQVVGVESKSLSRATLIGRTAIEHMQATNLGEVLQLLPGAVAFNPSFTNVNMTSIRQYESNNSEASYASSLGTSVVINGAPLSNNANLQAANTATGGVMANFSTASGMGIDMRQLSADNVESVEVIRGIPSVEYGDLTAGAIIVKTKASKEPAQFKARINPKLTQFWLGKGFGLGKDKGALFADIDFTKAYDDQIKANDAYERVTSSLQYTRTFGKTKQLFTNTTFAFAMNLDENKVDPDYEIDQVVRKMQDYSFRFSTTGKWVLGKQLARSLNYTLSASYAHQKGFQQQYYTSDISPVSTARENTTVEVDYLASRYLNQLWIDGKPLNIFAKLNDNFYVKTGAITHSFIVGGDWKLDANYGAGKTFDEKLPPRTTDNAGFRTRAFKEIPALNQLGLYAEDRISAKIANRSLIVQLGLRYDNIQPFSNNSKYVLAPRINASYELFENFAVRGGYGITAKAPTLLYLYPENAYFDYVSLNYYKDNPAERLAIMTTKVYNTENKDLKIAKTSKNELGFDWTFAKKKRLAVTAYYEQTRNGYEMNDYNINAYHFASIPKYTVESAPAGQKPVLSSNVTYATEVANYKMASNNRDILNKGIEFDLDMGRFNEIRTSFILNGALISTRSSSIDPFIMAQRVAGQPLTRLGVFAPRAKESQRFATTLRAIHNIPDLRFVITLAAQTIWMDKDKYLNYSSIPIGYIPVTSENQNAEVVYFTKEQRDAITSADRDLYLSLNEGYYREESWKPLWLFNIKLTKEFSKNMMFSFYANNVINHRPLQASKRYPTEFTKRNIDLFFGAEVSVKF